MFKKAKVLFVLDNSNGKSKRSVIEKLLDKYDLSISNIKNPNLNEIDSKESLDFFFSSIPHNTIVCQEHYTEEDNFYLALPFMSSHFSIPVKSGEIVWLYEDVNDFKIKENMLLINHYWISRMHGMTDSEDVNYSIHDRDINNRYKLNDTIENKESFIFPEIEYFNLKNIRASNKKNISLNKIIKSNNLKNKIVLEPVPRFFKKQGDFSIQGSNNTLINLSYENEDTKSGTITLLAGRKSNFQDFELKKLKNINTEDEHEVSFNKDKSFFKLKNKIDDFTFEENFKNVKDFTKLEQNTFFENSQDIIEDSSFIKISENMKCDFILDKKTSNQINTSNVTFSKSNIEYLGDNNNKSRLNVDNLEETKYKFSRGKSPLIFGKSTNITFLTLDNHKDSKNRTIRLINNGLDYNEEYSHITLEADSKINVDAKTIFIGNFLREIKKQGIPEKSKYEYKDFSSMHGNGSTIQLGYKKEISEPIALGQTLKSVLEELISINIKTIDNVNKSLNELKENVKKINNDIKKIQNNYDNHTHVSSPSGGPTSPTLLKLIILPTVPYLDNETNNTISNNADIQTKRLEDINKNLHKILSRIVKSS